MHTTTELESRMRPGAWSDGGFLGPTESLESVMAQDAKALTSYGVSYEQIADTLEILLDAAIEHTRSGSPYPNLYHPESVPKFDLNNLPDRSGSYVTGNLQVFTVGYKGMQLCPWGCSAGGSHDFLILNREIGEYITGAELVIHLIREHHFFEGIESPYRTDPTKLIRILELRAKK